MKKRPAIGLAVAVLAVSVVLGIASLPDEVLIDSSEIENSQTIPTDATQVISEKEAQEFVANALAQKDIDAAQAEIDALKKEMRELKSELVDMQIDSQAVDDDIETTALKETPSENTTQQSGGQTFKIKMKDGVGTDMR